MPCLNLQVWPCCCVPNVAQNKCKQCWPHSTGTEAVGQWGEQNLVSAKVQSNFWKVGSLYLSSTIQTIRSDSNSTQENSGNLRLTGFPRQTLWFPLKTASITTAKRWHWWCSHKLRTVDEGLDGQKDNLTRVTFACRMKFIFHQFLCL